MSAHTENTTAPAVPRRRALRREIAAEWVRLSSLRSTWWCVAAAVAGMALFAGLMGWTQLSAAREDALASQDVEFAQLTSQGYFYLVQFSVLVLAALASTGDFAHRSAAATLAWNPDRSVVLLARVLVTAVLASTAALLAGLVGTGVLAALLSGYVAFPVGEILATVFGAGLCMALFAALFVGVGTVLRGTAGTVAAGFLLLLGLPLVMQLSGLELVEDRKSVV